jgi:hypothetical protein
MYVCLCKGFILLCVPLSTAHTSVTRNIRKVTDDWGIRVIAFQLKSIELANAGYASEYEKASLELAKAEVDRRAIEALKEITVERARADAEAALTIARGMCVCSGMCMCMCVCACTMFIFHMHMHCTLQVKVTR